MPLRLVTPLVFKPDELYRVPTADGSAIALGRYKPRGEPRRRWPVILAHGLGTNRFAMDFDERLSAARALARRGFEAWVLELRGHGLAGSADGSSFDAEAIHDVGAALKAVLSTGVEGVAWVGHSRGGLLAYAHLARFPEAPIRAVVTLASPLSFTAQPHVQRFVGALGPALKLPFIPLSLSKAVAPFGLPPSPISPYLLNTDNVDAEVLKQSLAFVTADVPGGVARQFARWVTTGAFDGEDGFDYRAAMKALQVPMLAMAGAGDLLAPPSAVHEVSSLVSGAVEVVTAGRATGFRADYGHGDLLLGRHVPEDIWPRVADFLEHL